MRLLSCSLYDAHGDEILVEVTRGALDLTPGTRLVIEVVAERFAPGAVSPHVASTSTMVYDRTKARARGARHGLKIDSTGDELRLTECAVRAVADAVIFSADSDPALSVDALWEAAKARSHEILRSTVACLAERLFGSE